jgi:hypothetical protein
MAVIVSRNAGCEFDDYLATFSRGRLRGSFANHNLGFRVRDAMHDLEGAAKQLTIALKGIDDVCGHRKFRGAGNQSQSLGLEMGLYYPLRKISGATVLQYMLQSQPTDICGQRRTTEIWKAGVVSCVELWPPINVHIAALGFRFAIRVGRNQDEFFLEQLLDLQAGTALWSIHNSNIHPTLDEPLH